MLHHSTMSTSSFPTDESDDEIVRRIVAGEPALFEVLVRRHNQRMYRVTRGILGNDHDCEEVMQQAYVAAFVNLRQFRGSAQFSTWLTRIVVNEAIRRRRVESRWRDEMDRLSDAAGLRAPSPEHAAYARELAAVLETAIDALPFEYRVVFALRELEGLSTAETAASLDINEDAVKTRLHRAKSRLRRELVNSLGATTAQIYAFHRTRCDRVVSRVRDALTTLDRQLVQL
jgi:RNA polymerase sigma-70 factor, ECF subfamily